MVGRVSGAWRRVSTGGWSPCCRSRTGSPASGWSWPAPCGTSPWRVLMPVCAIIIPTLARRSRCFPRKLENLQSVSCWNGGYEQRAVSQRHPERRRSGQNKSVSGLLCGCALPCHYAWVCKDGSAYAGCPTRRRFSRKRVWISRLLAGDGFHIHLDPFTRASHLLVRFWRIGLFLLLLWEHAQFAHDPKQALRPMGIAALFQAVPL